MTRQRLALKRQMLGVITQSEAARLLGVTPEQVNRVLNGHRQSQRLIKGIEALIKEKTKEKAAQ